MQRLTRTLAILLVVAVVALAAIQIRAAESARFTTVFGMGTQTYQVLR